MQDFVLWWFRNVSYPFNEFIGDNLPVYAFVIFLVVCVINVLYFGKRLERFSTVMCLSASIAFVFAIFAFWFVMFLPFFLIVFASAGAFVWICYLIYESIKGKHHGN